MVFQEFPSLLEFPPHHSFLLISIAKLVRGRERREMREREREGRERESVKIINPGTSGGRGCYEFTYAFTVCMPKSIQTATNYTH